MIIFSGKWMRLSSSELSGYMSYTSTGMLLFQNTQPFWNEFMSSDRQPLQQVKRVLYSFCHPLSSEERPQLYDLILIDTVSQIN